MYKRIKKLFLNYIPTVVKTGVLFKMPFLYPVLEIKPSSSTIMITNRCNLKCIMCKVWREPAGDELETEDWKGIIEDLKKNGIRNIHFTGGEPLLRKDIKELISYGSRNGFVIGLTTNGLLLTEEILQGCLDAGLRSVAVSVDGVGSSYDDIRGLENSFERVKRAVYIVGEMRRKRKIDAYINFTLMRNNIKELKSVKRLSDDAGLPLGICLLDKNSSIFDLDENKDEFWISEDKDFEDLQGPLDFLKNETVKKPKSLLTNFPAIDFIKDYFRDPCQAHIPCASSQDRIVINPDGSLLGGCMSMGTFGNISETPLDKLLKKNKYRAAKRSMFFKKCAGCSCGYLFNIRCLPGLLVKDLFERIKCVKKNWL